MAKYLSNPSSEDFGLSEFSDLLAPRHPIVGENPDEQAVFRAALLKDLLPIRPYEYVQAEDILEIEWEIRQRRHLQRLIRKDYVTAQIVAAYLASELQLFRCEEEEARQKFLSKGGKRLEWVYDIEFDEEATMADGLELADRAGSPDVQERQEALEEIAALAIDPLRELSRAYTDKHGEAQEHEDKIADLQARVRELRRDYDLLQSKSPIEGEVFEA